MVRILVADDERDLVWALHYSLADEGYEVIQAFDGEQALALARREHPDLIVLDVMMPRMDGLEVCRRLRRDPSVAAVPILLLTVRSDIEDRVTGLNGGCDDYLVKPFDLRELKARVRALLRRGTASGADSVDSETLEPVLVQGSLSLDPKSRQVTVGGRAAQLTPLEFKLLKYLMSHPDQVLTADRLLRAVWGYEPSNSGSNLVRWHIRNLRSKIEPDPAQPTYIHTVSHHGYVFKSSA